MAGTHPSTALERVRKLLSDRCASQFVGDEIFLQMISQIKGA